MKYFNRANECYALCLVNYAALVAVLYEHIAIFICDHCSLRGFKLETAAKKFEFVAYGEVEYPVRHDSLLASALVSDIGIIPLLGLMANFGQLMVSNSGYFSSVPPYMVIQTASYSPLTDRDACSGW